ncbi:hypothetical protein KFL_001910090 [Klebsormidium nitens]|uniref:Uncharacterized protein n=1 Tax=Klebsormidium nitens TaxID=105231 RepID=A0A1Y1I0M4_KLENI|nr:hypothetical protein KFL_001910090 [Klebsormidium nitens]|eukprot:GAQ84490.1 hypothetical protein KFL_001910090 [Klebsormidium nitens]
MVSPQSLAGFQQGGWLLAAVLVSFLYAMFMFAAILSSVYRRGAFVPWLFVGAATSAIMSSGLVFTAALRLHQQRLEHHQANSHRYRRRRHSRRSFRSATPSPKDLRLASPMPSNLPSNLGVKPNLPPSSPNPSANPGPPNRLPIRSILFKALPHLEQGMSGASTPGGAETPGRSTPSLEWNLAIGVDPKQETPSVSLTSVLCATASLAASVITTLTAFTLAEASDEGTVTEPSVYLGVTGLLLFVVSLGLIAYAVVRRGSSPDGTYAVLWLVVDAPSHFAPSRQGTNAHPTPRTPKTPRVFTTDLESVMLTPSERSSNPRPALHTPRTPRILTTDLETAELSASKLSTSPQAHPPGTRSPPVSPKALERAVARILRGTVKTNIVVALGGLYLNLPLAIIPIVASMFVIGPQRVVVSDQRPLVYGILFPLLFLVSALDFATFFFFVPRSISATWLALKHPRIASSHVRSGRGAMMLSSVVLFVPFVEFYFCLACVTVYLSAEGGSVGFGDLVLTPWQCFEIFSVGLLVIILTSLVCIVSLKVRLSQWIEPHKLSSRTTKGVVYASLLVFVVVGLVTSLFQSLLARSLCLIALVAFVPIFWSRRQAEQARI